MDAVSYSVVSSISEAARRRAGAGRHAGGREAVPDQPVRRRIYAHLLALPGDHFRSIARALHLDTSTARHHLEALVRQGWVIRDDWNGRCRYYPVGPGCREERNRLYMDHWKYRDLRLRVLIAARGMASAGPTDVARSLRISRQLAGYHLARLQGMGLLRRVDGRYVART